MRMKRNSELKDFWFINKDTNCWVWQGSCNRGGYPQYNKHGKLHLAHRYVYTHYTKIVLNPKLQLDHICKNIKCVNPEHLEEVTQHVNLERAGMLKVSFEQVLEIRKLYQQRNITQKDLAIKFCINQQQISRIVNNIDRKYA